MNFDGLGLMIVVDGLKFKCWVWENGNDKDLSYLKFNKIFIFYLRIIYINNYEFYISMVRFGYFCSYFLVKPKPNQIVWFFKI